jgi:hypothetical protein
MAMFVHIGDARARRAFRQDGLTPNRRLPMERRGVFAMPVLRNYFVSHQWLREIRRGGAREFVGVYFRVPDRDLVLVGHYNQPHLRMTAARACRVVMDAPDPRGYEIIVPRKVQAKDIHAIRSVNRIVGWRYYPDAHGRPLCVCPVCVPRGSIKSRRLREAWQAQRTLREAKTSERE